MCAQRCASPKLDPCTFPLHVDVMMSFFVLSQNVKNVGDAVDDQLKQREDEGIFDDYEPYLHICNLRPSAFNVKNTSDFLKVVKFMSGGDREEAEPLIVSNGTMDFHDLYKKARDNKILEEEKERDRVKIAALEEKAAEAALARDLHIERQKAKALRDASSSDNPSSSDINCLQEELIKVRQELMKERNTTAQLSDKIDRLNDEKETALGNLQSARDRNNDCLLYTSPSPRDRQKSRMPSSA